MKPYAVGKGRLLAALNTLIALWLEAITLLAIETLIRLWAKHKNMA